MARGGFSTSNYLGAAAAAATAVPITMSAWVLPTVVNTQQQLVQIRNSASAGSRNAFEMYLDNSTLIGGASGPSSFVAASVGGMQAGVWQHVGAVFASATSRKVYRDGVNTGTNTTSSTPSGVNQMGIGLDRAGSGGAPCTGLIAEVAFWSAALTDDEIVALAKGFAPPLVHPDGLVTYLPLIRDLVDLKGSPWTMAGTVPVGDHCRVLLAA